MDRKTRKACLREVQAAVEHLLWKIHTVDGYINPDKHSRMLKSFVSCRSIGSEIVGMVGLYLLANAMKSEPKGGTKIFIGGLLGMGAALLYDCWGYKTNNKRLWDEFMRTVGEKYDRKSIKDVLMRIGGLFTRMALFPWAYRRLF